LEVINVTRITLLQTVGNPGWGFSPGKWTGWCRLKTPGTMINLNNPLSFAMDKRLMAGRQDIAEQSVRLHRAEG